MRPTKLHIFLGIAILVFSSWRNGLIASETLAIAIGLLFAAGWSVSETVEKMHQTIQTLQDRVQRCEVQQAAAIPRSSHLLL